MSVIQNNLLLTGDDGYNLTKSLRFRSSASAYLNRTPASAGNRTTWTWSAWVKRGALDGNRQVLFACYNGTNNDTGVTELEFDGSNYLVLNGYSATWRVTSQVFRDPSAWYHLVLAVDTTQATGANRIKLYVNGTQITSFSSSSDPSQNYTLAINSAARHTLSNIYDSTPRLYFDGYLTEVNFIDGQALTPSSFGETSSTTGVWQPKRYTGTYGTNGFYLPFTDNSALTSGSNAGLGKDFSGNGNYWNTNNISITSGATYDSMTDVPTLTSATTANYCVLNPLNSPSTTLSNANLTVTTATSGTNYATGTFAIPTSGKWYWEYVGTSNGNEGFCGVATSTASLLLAYYGATGIKWVNGSGSAYGATYTNNDVIGVAVDVDAGTVTFYKNNVSQGAITYSVTSDTFFPYFADGSSSVGATFQVNFGQRPFAYTPPTGYVALNTYNLPTPTIGATASSQANKYMDATVYTGTGSTLNVNNSGSFAPDLVWIKGRSGATDHGLHDRLRGEPYARLASNNTDAETTGGSFISSYGGLTSTGFQLNTNTSGNNNGSTYVAWQWKANGTGVTNTAGSITSTVSANTTSGFSVVTYTGDSSSNQTIGHGLGVAPAMIICKSRNAGFATNWVVWHKSLPSSTDSVLLMNTTGATLTVANYWGSAAPTSTVFGVKGGGYDNNQNGVNQVAYCFSEIAGFSKFGSYTGNGSSDGVFVALPFKPKFVMTKRTDSSTGGNWMITDDARNPYNLAGEILMPNNSDTEYSQDGIDLLSNGFKLRASTNNRNANGGTYIYMAFAEVPQKFALGV